jgi:myo-inositol 2-dehydrogenase/D-chiro-inositol 1-dehydrogenase
MHGVADYFQQVADTAGDALGVDKSRRFSGLSGYRKLIESGIEAIALETPPCFFPEHARAAVEAGLHVYMAKPVAVDVPGCAIIEAAAKKSAASKKCFLVDYQIPTDPFNIEALNRARDGGLGTLQVVRSHYYGGLFPDPALTATIESRLRHLTWCNDVALGGGYHGNACIHSIQAGLLLVGKPPLAATGFSGIRRHDPHGDSHDVFSVAFHFADGLVWNHVGRHGSGLYSPDEPFSGCEFLADTAYLRIGYGGKTILRGGAKQYAGGEVQNLYEAGAVRNIAAFHRNVTEGLTDTSTARLAVDSCLMTILAREACLRGGTLAWDQLLKENKALTVDLSGLKA